MGKILLHIGAILFFVVLSQSAGGLGSVFTISSVETWYQFLSKPPLTPPDWIFGPVWGVLYTLMGIATYIIWRSKHPKRWRAIGLFIVHLIVNTAWSIIYFGEQSILGGLVTIVLLDILIIWIIVRYRNISKAAAYLLVPYLAWVLFATYLNAGILLLN